MSHQEMFLAVRGKATLGALRGAKIGTASDCVHLEKLAGTDTLDLYTVHGVGEGKAVLTATGGQGTDELKISVVGGEFRKVPAFAALAAHYPLSDETKTDDEQAEAVKLGIGGQVHAAWITNTCTIRMSRSFDYAGAPVPTNFAGLHTIRGADGKPYAFRVAEFKRYFERTYGPPNIVRVPVAGPIGVDPAAFNKHQGVLCFEVHWADATGHFTLWDKGRALHGSYFPLAKRVSLWEC